MSTKARAAFWDVALGNNSKLANLAKLAIQEAEDETQQRKPLTDAQIEEIVSSLTVSSDGYIRFSASLRQFARAIEAAHGIKE